MFNRAKFLMRHGDNPIARKLLIRCIELNPYDSHRYKTLATGLTIQLWLSLLIAQLAGAGKIGGAGRQRRYGKESLHRQQREVPAKHPPATCMGSLRTGPILSPLPFRHDIYILSLFFILLETW